MRFLAGAIVVLYALMAHAVLAGPAGSLAPAVAGLLPLALLAAAWAGRSRTLLAAAFVLAGVVSGLAAINAASLLLFLPPIVIHGFLAWMFGSTLRVGSEPLIVRFIRLVHGPDKPPDAAMLAYARRVTLLWALLFAAIAVIELLMLLLVVPDGLLARLGLAFPGPAPTSAHFGWFANAVSWLAMAALMGVEWQVRKRRFPGMPYRNFADFLRRLVAVGPQVARAWRHD